MPGTSGNILITGANGFLGAHVVESLKKDGKITCLVRRDVQIEGTTTLIFHNSNDPVFEQAVNGIDVIIHIAAQLHGPMEEMMDANVTFTKNLVSLALKKGVKHFIYISTENVSQGNMDIYSKTKELGEKEVALFPSHLILRPTIIYGPGDTKYVGRLMNIIRKYPFVPVLGNGKSLFQFVYVDDLVHVIREGLEKRISGTFTIAGPESITYNEFMQNLMAAMHVKKVLLHAPMWILKPFAHFFNLIMRKPPLTPTQLDNLMKDRSYAIDEVVKIFNYQPTDMKTGLSKILTGKQ